MNSLKMRIQAKIPILFGIFAILLAPSASVKDATFKGSLEQFSYNIFSELVKSSGNKNIIYSPFSTQTCLAMVRMGADGETAIEMDRVLGFTGQTTESIANNYNSLLAHYENSGDIHVANKVYVMKDCELQDNYRNILSKKFFSAPESIDFEQHEMAANAMNNWVESKTNHLITNLVAPDALNADTRLVLLNAVHFQGEWLHVFVNKHTVEDNFFTDESNCVKVQMMERQARFEVGKFPELNASAIRMPYKDSDLSMLIVLPHSRTGLAELQEKLMDVKLESLTSKMRHAATTLRLPKFNVEYEIDMTEPLAKLGLVHMFDNGDFGKMLKLSQPISVSNVFHKAFIKVTERGTEAAAVTKLQIATRMRHKPFVVDHPFYYAIVNNDNVILFQGYVVEL